jgi:hypothetical protein
MMIAGSRRVMGEFAITGALKVMGWLATGAMAFAAVGMFILA